MSTPATTARGSAPAQEGGTHQVRVEIPVDIEVDPVSMTRIS
jgi:hypothetical protein